MAVFLIDERFFKEARQELEKALQYNEDLSEVHNKWGYYYHKIGNHKEAITSFHKAIQLKPDRFSYYNNLGFALFEADKKKESLTAFIKSLNMNNNQPWIKQFVSKHNSKKE